MSVCDPFALESRDLSFSTWHIIRSRRKTSKPELPVHYFKSLMVWHLESFYGFRSKITFKGPFFNFLFLGLFLAAAIVSRFVVSPCWAELVVSTIAISPAIWSSGRKQVQGYDRNNQAIQHWRFFSVIYIYQGQGVSFSWHFVLNFQRHWVSNLRSSSWETDAYRLFSTNTWLFHSAPSVQMRRRVIVSHSM